MFNFVLDDGKVEQCLKSLGGEFQTRSPKEGKKKAKAIILNDHKLKDHGGWFGVIFSIVGHSRLCHPTTYRLSYLFIDPRREAGYV